MANDRGREKRKNKLGNFEKGKLFTILKVTTFFFLAIHEDQSVRKLTDFILGFQTRDLKHLQFLDPIPSYVHHVQFIFHSIHQ